MFTGGLRPHQTVLTAIAHDWSCPRSRPEDHEVPGMNLPRPFYLLVSGAAALALAAAAALAPAASASPLAVIQPQSPSGIAGWTETGSYGEFALTAGEGVATVTSGDSSVFYRGAGSVPLSEAIQGWTHIGDPDSASGYIIDNFQG